MITTSKMSAARDLLGLHLLPAGDIGDGSWNTRIGSDDLLERVGAMALIDRPWARVKNPVPIPDPCTADSLAALDDMTFAELVRSHLVPRGQSTPDRRAWEGLWSLLRSDQLADRTYDVLEDFLDTTEEAIGGGDLDSKEQARAEKFRMQCQHSWNRIDRDRTRDAPLAWAGSAGQFPPAAQRVIAQLVGAIARHRATVLHREGKPSPADAELWDILRKLDLDPRDYPN